MTRRHLTHLLPGVAGWFALALLTSAPLEGRRQTPSAEALAARIQARYDGVRDFTADFTLAQTGGLAFGSSVDRGTVAIKKPGRMRWKMTTGSRQEIVSDGATLYSYMPADKYVQVTPLPAGNRASSGLLLLSGRGSITRDFVPELAPEQPESEWRLQLTPKAPEPEFTSLTLVTDRTSLRLRGLEITNAQGGTQKFTFSNLRENQGLSDSVFQFKMPKGVVIRN